jgi:hypothetical protein
MEKKLNTTALNTMDDVRMISDEDLGAVTGGSNPVRHLDGGGGSSGGGGHGRVISHGPSGSDIAGVFGVLAIIAIGFAL